MSCSKACPLAGHTAINLTHLFWDLARCTRASSCALDVTYWQFAGCSPSNLQSVHHRASTSLYSPRRTRRPQHESHAVHETPSSTILGHCRTETVLNCGRPAGRALRPPLSESPHRHCTAYDAVPCTAWCLHGPVRLVRPWPAWNCAIRMGPPRDGPAPMQHMAEDLAPFNR